MKVMSKMKAMKTMKVMTTMTMDIIMGIVFG